MSNGNKVEDEGEGGGKGREEREKKGWGPKRWTTHTHTTDERDRGGPSSYCNAEVSILAALSYSPRQQQQHDTSAIVPPTTK